MTIDSATGPMRSILLVDDEENVLRGYQRTLRGKFDVDTAVSGQAALELFHELGPYPVIVSDMRMPQMSGVELLEQVKAQWPDTVRVLLTGNTDQETAVAAINQGDVFRFLNKPCPANELISAINTAIQHHDLLVAEQELLEQTVKGAVEALVELLSLARPDVMGQTMRLTKHLRGINQFLTAPLEPWMLETAGFLSQLGYTTLSKDVVQYAQSGQAMDGSQLKAVDEAIALAAGIVARIPRLEEVAEIIRYQDKHFDGGGVPQKLVGCDEIPPGARVLKCALDYERLLTAGEGANAAADAMAQYDGRYDPEIFTAFRSYLEAGAEGDIKQIEISALTSQMQLAEDVVTTNGVLLVPRGIEASDSVQAHLRRFRDSGQIGDVVAVFDEQVAD